MTVAMDLEIEIENLAKASSLYYSGKPSGMDDAEFDARWRDARQADPDHPFFRAVGAPPAGEKKARHLVMMGSLENILDSRVDLVKWWNGLPVVTAAKRALVLQNKVDGAAVELVYADGHFIRAVTRGDGAEGEDVTANVRRSTDRSFPRFIKTPVPGTLSILAEAVLFKKDFAAHFQDAATARAAVAGTLGRKSGAGSEQIRFVAYGVKGSGMDLTEAEQCDQLEAWRFRTPASETYFNIDDVWTMHKEREVGRDNLPYEIDGTVVKLNADTLGSQGGRPHGQRAIKFRPLGAEAVVQDVRWQVGMNRVTPVLVIQPVKIGGVEITNVTLHNVEQFRKLALSKGDTVTIVRSGDVIPMITGVVKRAFPDIPEQAAQAAACLLREPGECPECGGVLAQSGASLVCESESCSGRAAQIAENWCVKRNIRALGPAVIAAVDAARGPDGLTIADLYELDYAALSAVETVSESGKRVKVGKNAHAILAEIEKSRDVTFADFFGSLGIHGIGRRKCRKIVDAFPRCKALGDFFALQKHEVEAVPGFAGPSAFAFVDYLATHRVFIWRLAGYMRFQTPTAAKGGSMKGQIVCFTGNGGVKRSDLTRMAIDSGAEVRSSVTGDLTILVCADMNSISSKAQKAKANGVTLMSVTDFLAKCAG